MRYHCPISPNRSSKCKKSAPQRGFLANMVRRICDLRHTSTTLLLAEGVHGKIVQERLGHADIAMTLDLYSHVTSDTQRQAADALETKIASVEQRSA